MAFRNHSYRPSLSSPTKVEDIVLTHDIVDGVDIVTPTLVDAASLRHDVPLPDDYRLSALLAAGVPLIPVDPLLFNDVDSQASHVIDDIISSDSSVDTSASTSSDDSNNIDNNNI